MNNKSRQHSTRRTTGRTSHKASPATRVGLGLVLAGAAGLAINKVGEAITATPAAVTQAAGNTPEHYAFSQPEDGGIPTVTFEDVQNKNAKQLGRYMVTVEHDGTVYAAMKAFAKAEGRNTDNDAVIADISAEATFIQNEVPPSVSNGETTFYLRTNEQLVQPHAIEHIDHTRVEPLSSAQ